MRRIAAALAVLLAVAPAAALPSVSPTPATTADPAAASTMAPVVADNNTTEYLALPDSDVEVRRVETVTLDVGAAMAADNAAIYGRVGVVRLVEAYRDADTRAEQRAVLRESAARLEERVDALRARERRAREQFNAGELSTTEFLRTLVRIDARAGKLRQAIVRLDAYNDALAEPALAQERIASMRARIVILDGPVRDLIRRAMAGDVSTVRVHIATTGTGMALSAVVPDEGKYRREAYVLDNRRPNGTNEFEGPVEAFERLTEIYPHAYNLSKGYGGIAIRTSDLIQVGVYGFSVEHKQGSLVTYLDGATRTAFYEIQRKDLSSVPTAAPVTNADDDLFVQVNRTRAGGPVEIRVRNAVSLEPVDARVAVNGHVVGRTGADGRIWTVTPPRAMKVTATRGSANVTVTASPNP